VLVCLLLLYGVGGRTPVPKNIADPSPKETEPLAFLVSYALPLVAAKEEAAATLLGLVAFAFLMGVALWQLQVFHVNPLLAVFGYRFYAAKSDGTPVLVLARRVTPVTGVARVVRISDYLWLFKAGENDGSASDA